MASTAPTHRVARALTPNEVGTILTAVNAATSTADLLADAVRSLFTALLAGTGTAFGDFTPEHRLNPGDYAIPSPQWNMIAKAITDHAAQWGTAAQLALELVATMPASYDDPAAYTPTLATVDRRPMVHHLRVTRDAVDVIAACERHIAALADAYGHGSLHHLQALTSWHAQLARLFSLGFGERSQISRDGRLSLFVTTSSRFVFAVVFHGARRRCTSTGCEALISDDGDASPPYRDATVVDHEHTPSYLCDGPQPGTWSFHS